MTNNLQSIGKYRLQLRTSRCYPPNFGFSKILWILHLGLLGDYHFLKEISTAYGLHSRGVGLLVPVRSRIFIFPYNTMYSVECQPTLRKKIPSRFSDKTNLTSCFTLISCLIYPSSLMMAAMSFRNVDRLNGLHCVISQKTELFLIPAVSTSNAAIFIILIIHGQAGSIKCQNFCNYETELCSALHVTVSSRHQHKGDRHYESNTVII
jgi:hypothetical protein